MDKKRWLTTTGTLLGLVCGLALTQQVAADTDQTNQSVAVTTPTTSEQNVGNDNTGADNESPTTDASVTPAPAPTGNVGQSSMATAASVNSTSNDNALNNANVTTNVASTTTPTNPTPDATTSEVIATGTWGTSNWDYVHQGDDYTLTFHAGTLGEGHRYNSDGIDTIDEPKDDEDEYGSIGGDPDVFNENSTWINELTQIQFEPGVVANANSSFLFAYLPVKRILGLSNLDTSNVTTMQGMFRNIQLTADLDLSRFNTSHVTNMRGMFGRGSYGNLDLSSLDTSNVTDMSDMFAGSTFTSLDISKLNTSQVTTMKEMFNDIYGITSLDLRNFDTSNVTDMYGMFANYSNGELQNIDVSSFNTAKVTTMYGMFTRCGIGNADLRNFDTSNVTTMYGMFADCQNLTEVNLKGWDTSKVTNMRGMFATCMKLKKVDVSNWDVRKVTDVQGMFVGDFDLNDLDLSTWTFDSLINGYCMTAYTPLINFKVFKLNIDDPKQVDPILGYVNVHWMIGGDFSSLDLSSWNISDSSLADTEDLIYSQNLSHIVVSPNIKLPQDLDVPEVGTKIPGTNKTVASQHWVATKGYQQGTKYTPDELAQTTDRDQITTYDWDSEPFVPDRVEKKAVTRTINVHQPDGRLQTQTQTITLKRNVHYNDDDTVDYGDWSKDQWDAYTVPIFAGYQASQAEVPAQTVDAYGQDQTVDIYYTPVEQTVTIQYLDDGQEVGTQTLTGYVGDVLTLNYHAPKGYELLEQPQTTITIDGSGQQIIQVAVDHQIQTSSQTKTILRTINVNYPSGMTKSYDQVAVLKQNLYIDQVTGDQVYGTWSTGNWDEFSAPVISGYTASQATVAAQTVTSNDQDQVVDVYYTKN